MSDTSELDRLNEEAAAARKVLLGIEVNRSKREQELDAATQRTLDAEFGDALRLARTEAETTQQAADAEEDRVRLAEAPSKLPYPEGTVLAEWEHPYTWGTSKQLVATGKRARVEVFRAGDVWCGASYRKPSIGAVVIRTLLKDGKPGKTVETWNPSWMERRWKPEGVKT
jgi:hypothetical protein